MSLAGALDVLTALAVTGVTTNYDYDANPGFIPDSLLPALIVVSRRQYGEGFGALDVSLANGEAVIYFDHVLLIGGLGQGRALDRLGAWVGHVDNYLAALAGDMTMTGNLVEPLRLLGISPGVKEWMGVAYNGVTFSHRWVLKV